MASDSTDHDERHWSDDSVGAACMDFAYAQIRRALAGEKGGA